MSTLWTPTSPGVGCQGHLYSDLLASLRLLVSCLISSSRLLVSTPCRPNRLLASSHFFPAQLTSRVYSYRVRAPRIDNTGENLKRTITAAVLVAAAVFTGAANCDHNVRPNRPTPTASNFVGTAPATQQNQGPAPAEPQLGAYCSMNDLYKERNDKQGRKLRCGPDKAGTVRWQLIPD